MQVGCLSLPDELDRFVGSCVMKERSSVKNGVWKGSALKMDNNNIEHKMYGEIKLSNSDVRKIIVIAVLQDQYLQKNTKIKIFCYSIAHTFSSQN